MSEFPSDPTTPPDESSGAPTTQGEAPAAETPSETGAGSEAGTPSESGDASATDAATEPALVAEPSEVAPSVERAAEPERADPAVAAAHEAAEAHAEAEAAAQAAEPGEDAVPAATEGEEAHEGEASHPRPIAQRPRGQRAALARERALARFCARVPADLHAHVAWTLEALEKGVEPLFLGRFRRERTGGQDERRLAEVRDTWRRLLADEDRRLELHDILATRGALTEELAQRLDAAEDLHAMEDLAAPWLPVTASRATVARGHGLQGLADAIREAKEASPLSDLAKPFVKEGSEIASLDAALAGARDILAEAICLDVTLRRRLRELFRRASVLTVTLRGDRKGDAGRHGPMVGFVGPAAKTPPLKLLAIRRGERERVLSATCEPPEARAIEVVHEATAKAYGAEHPFLGFLRAAAEDGYRRILKPMLQAEVRSMLKERADEVATETFERSLKNLLLGPVGGPRKTLGLRPDVTAGHRAAAVDETGRPVYFGRLPHEATAGREAAVTALRELLVAHGIEVVAVGLGGGRREALGLAQEASKDLPGPVELVEVADGGTRALETAAVEKPVQTELGTEIPAECVGALSLARRFQDPLAEYVRLDPKSLGLGPNVHDVHQGRLRERLDEVIAACVAHAGPDAATASAELLARLPGFDLGKARAFVAWREAGNRLAGKAALGAVEGVGLAAAERAVGFLRVSTSEDPRDRTLLHPEQFGLLEEMAAQVESDVEGLFRDPRLRARVDLGRLARPEVPLPVLKYALYQATAGLADPRPRWGHPTKPPADVTLATLRPGLVLEGRVVRAVPFGVFVDVGLGVEALVPLPHIGDRPGIDPATIAPVGAVVQGRVLEVDLPKRRVTLTMRHDPEERRGPSRGGGGFRREGPPRRDRPAGRGPDHPPSEGGERPREGGPPRGDRSHFGPDRAPQRGGGHQDRRPAPEGHPLRRAGVAPSRGGSGRGGGGGGGDRGRGDRKGGGRFDRDDFAAPRRISLPPEAEAPVEAASPAEETELTPAQLLAKKIEEMKRRLARPE